MLMGYIPNVVRFSPRMLTILIPLLQRYIPQSKIPNLRFHCQIVYLAGHQVVILIYVTCDAAHIPY